MKLPVGVPPGPIQDWMTAATKEFNRFFGLGGISKPANATQLTVVEGLPKWVAPTTGFSMPVGALMPYAGTAAPTGWLLCDGAAVSRTTYADLFAVIDDDFGVGDGTTTFNVPNLGGRVAVGVSGGYARASSGGAATHTLTVLEIPDHTHLEKDPGNGVGIRTEMGEENIEAGGGGAALGFSGDTAVATTDGGGSSPGGGSHNNMQPYLVTNYIIKI